MANIMLGPAEVAISGSESVGVVGVVQPRSRLIPVAGLFTGCQVGVINNWADKQVVGILTDSGHKGFIHLSGLSSQFGWPRRSRKVK